MMGSGMLFSMLAPGQVIRVIMDIGTAAIEIFSFLSCAFISVRIILQEMEDRTVYLILSRPVSRPIYIIGRFFGIIGLMAVYILIMTLFLIITLLLKGWVFNSYIFLIAFSIFLKVSIVSSFSILISLISTSPASSFISIFFLWTLGHFSEELKYINYLLKEEGVRITFFLKTVYYLLPNFSKLNYKDFFHVSFSTVSTDFLWMTCYSFLYSAVLIYISILIYMKKEL